MEKIEDPELERIIYRLDRIGIEKYTHHTPNDSRFNFDPHFTLEEAGIKFEITLHRDMLLDHERERWGSLIISTATGMRIEAYGDGYRCNQQYAGIDELYERLIEKKRAYAADRTAQARKARQDLLTDFLA